MREIEWKYPLKSSTAEEQPRGWLHPIYGEKEMQTFIWSPQFETGIESVDEQHLRLVELINLIANLVIEGKDDDAAVDAILGELGEYASFHFDEEESLMEECSVDRRHILPHQSQHSQFIEQLSQMWDKRESLDKPAEALGNYLSSWLATHILEEDQSMARQMTSIKHGATATAAYESERPSK